LWLPAGKLLCTGPPELLCTGGHLLCPHDHLLCSFVELLQRRAGLCRAVLLGPVVWYADPGWRPGRPAAAGRTGTGSESLVSL